MLEAVSLSALIARPRYGGAWVETGCYWQRPDCVGLQMLCEGAVSVEKAADSLGRSPTALAHRAYDTGLKLPPEWRDLIRPKRLRAEPRVPLNYPFIMAVRGEHTDLLAVNALVPHGLLAHIRADVCQEIMLAIWEGRATIEELRRDRKLLSKFIGAIRTSNYEAGGHALSLDAPMRSWYDVLSA